MTLCYLATPDRYLGYTTDQSVPNKENTELAFACFSVGCETWSLT